MNRISVIAIVVTILFLMAAQLANAKDYVIGENEVPAVKPDPSSIYVGSEKCKMCHIDKYNDWKTTGHPYELLTPSEAKGFGIPFPDGYTESDIYMVIGGWGWKSLFIDNNGYIITKTGPQKDKNGSNQYNIATKTWVDYGQGMTLKYDCGNCHTTGYSLSGSNKPGIVGTWEEKSIGCEACHGPGSVHVNAGGGRGFGILKNSSPELCGQCHTRDDAKIISTDGFIDSNQQYPELLNSPHKALSCVACHDPHKGMHAGQTNPKEGGGMKTQCVACHSKQNSDFTGSTMQKAGVKCIDCHMPKVGKSAISDGYQGDVRGHLFKINTDVNAKMFSDDGGSANGYLTLERICLNCHNDKDKVWAGQNAKDIHIARAEAADTTLSPKPVETSKSPGFEVFIGIVTLMAALLFVRRR